MLLVLRYRVFTCDKDENDLFSRKETSGLSFSNSIIHIKSFFILHCVRKIDTSSSFVICMRSVPNTQLKQHTYQCHSAIPQAAAGKSSDD